MIQWRNSIDFSGATAAGFGDAVVVHRVVLVCGLPGAGKSTICRRLAKEYCGTADTNMVDDGTADEASADDATAEADDDEDTTAAGTTTASRLVHVIEYDQLMQIDRRCTTSTTPQQQQHPPSLDGDDEDDDDCDDHLLAAWRAARTIALEQLRQRIRDTVAAAASNKKAAAPETMMSRSSNGDSSGSSSSTSFLTILDDNFYLRSMRKDVCRTLQQLQSEFLAEQQQEEQQPLNVVLLFGSIFVDAPVSVCLNRNAARQRQVPPHVIRRMHERMQVPMGTDTYYWDRCTFRFLAYHHGYHDVVEEEESRVTGVAVPWTDAVRWQSLHEFVRSGLQPIPYPRHDDQQRHQQAPASSDYDTTTNLAQRRDAHWRSCVSTIARQWPHLAPAANQARRRSLSLVEASQLDYWRLLLASADLKEDDPVAHTLRSALMVLGPPPV
jgi:tRNA uridine 5-carbamoylmethylation protein Kti12